MLNMFHNVTIQAYIRCIQRFRFINKTHTRVVNEKARVSKIYEALSICFDRKWPCSDGPRPERLTAQVRGEGPSNCPDLERRNIEINLPFP